MSGMEAKPAVEGGALTRTQSLPWQGPALVQALSALRGHAVLVHASAGEGALEFAFGLAQGWLCEQSEAVAEAGRVVQAACGQCTSCRLAQGDGHPDLKLLLPETVRMAQGWPLEVPERRKPSRQIRIEDVRDGIAWMTHSSARGRGKVMLLHPATALNTASASALLKTLEEPPGAARIVLTARDPALLLPTVLSRCQRWRPPAPTPDAALQWLLQKGVPLEDARGLLQATAQQPLEALAWHREGVTARAWAALPGAVAHDDAQGLLGASPSRAVHALLKVCHDALLRCAGATPRFFPVGAVPAGAAAEGLIGWHKSLLQVAQHADHPWNEPLLLEALVTQGAQAWAKPARTGRSPQSRSPASRIDTLNP